MAEGDGADLTVSGTDGEKKDKIRKDAEAAVNSGWGAKTARFVMSCLGGAIPLVGGAISGAASAWSENEQAGVNKLFDAWLRMHEQELKEIAVTLVEVMMRLDSTNPEIMKRIESPEYLSIVRKCVRDWSAAESEEKRVLVRKLLTHAAETRIVPDDVIKLFAKWIADYNELHFKVIRDIYQNPGSTRHDIWQRIHGERVREDSSEADLFKLLIRDLSTGQVIRQHREKDYHGNFIKQRPGRTKGHRGQAMTSAFDDGQEYELTELGAKFVHYTMEEIVPKLAGAAESEHPSHEEEVHE